MTVQWGELWRRFRAWPTWAQAAVWIVAWPVPLLVLLAMARPRSRPFWGAVAAIGTFAWAAVLVSTGGQSSTVEADTSTTTSTSTTSQASTTSERIATSTTATATTSPSTTGSLPPNLASDPVRTGGLTTGGAGSFDVEALLSLLTVAPESSASAYDRSLFEHWIDDDGDSCDTRAEVLQAESYTPAQTDPYRCHVVTGDWLSIYDGYTTDDPSELDIDHLVALGEAWRSGASTWSNDRRRSFANDLDHPGALVAVTAAMNRSKSDKDPAIWQPPNRSAWCLYAYDWITVKSLWDLTADQAEATALRNMLYGCGNGDGAAAPATTAFTSPPTTASTDRAGCDTAYPTVCIPPAPPDLDCGDIPHRRFQVLAPDPHRFDGNHDGVGCEG